MIESSEEQLKRELFPICNRILHNLCKLILEAQDAKKDTDMIRDYILHYHGFPSDAEDKDISSKLLKGE